MKVREVMNRQVLKVSPSDTLSKTLEVMLRFYLNEVVVVNGEDALVGIVTYSDLVRTLLPSVQEFMENSQQYFMNPELTEDHFKDISNVPIKDVMTTKVTTTTPDTHATQAAAMMTAHHVKALPVVENDAVVGIVGHRDVGWGFMMTFMTRPEQSKVFPKSSLRRLNKGMHAILHERRSAIESGSRSRSN